MALFCLQLVGQSGGVEEGARAQAPIQINRRMGHAPSFEVLVHLNAAEAVAVNVYKPDSYCDGPLLICCHGVGRNTVEYLRYAMPLARRHGAIVAAPYFDLQRFPPSRYQLGGLLNPDGTVAARDQWTFGAIEKIVAYVRAAEGRPNMPYYLIGHSAGGQFLLRLAAFMPGEARRIVAANCGSLLFPDRDQKYRYGFGGLPEELSNDSALERYLAAPVVIYLGTEDTRADTCMNSSPEAQRQGPDRLSRGRACFTAAKTLAAQRGWAFNWRKVEAPGIDHDASRMLRAEEASEALFGHQVK